MVKEITGSYKIKFHPNGVESGEEPVEIDFTPPFKRVHMIPELENATGVKFGDPAKFGSPEFNKLLSDLCVKHEVECPAPRTTARLLDKVSY